MSRAVIELLKNDVKSLHELRRAHEAEIAALRAALAYIADSALGNSHSLSEIGGGCVFCRDVQRAARSAIAPDAERQHENTPGGDRDAFIRDLTTAPTVTENTWTYSRPTVKWTPGLNIPRLVSRAQMALAPRGAVDAGFEMWERVKLSFSYDQAVAIVRQYVVLVEDAGDEVSQ